MMTVRSHPRFDWKRVRWGGPKDRISWVCSYCSDAIPQNSVPLRLFTDTGHGAVLCDDCATYAIGKVLEP